MRKESMLNLTNTFENALISAGIPIYKSRKQMLPFHSTIGVVTADYPIQQALQIVNQNVSFSDLPPYNLHAFDTFLPEIRHHTANS